MVFVKNLRSPQGRPKATVRHHLKVVRQPQVSSHHKFKIRRAATVANVTTRVCGRGNSAATVELQLAVEILDRTAAVANVTEALKIEIQGNC